MNNIIKSEIGDFTNLQQIKSTKTDRLWQAELNEKKVLLLLDENKENIVSTALALKPESDFSSLHIVNDHLVTDKSKTESYIKYDREAEKEKSEEEYLANYQARVKLYALKEGIQLDDPQLTQNANQFLSGKIATTLKLQEAEAYKQKLLECLSNTNVSTDTMKKYLTSRDMVAIKKMQANFSDNEISGVVKADILAKKSR